jgi:hypothetical protein
MLAEALAGIYSRVHKTPVLHVSDAEQKIQVCEFERPGAAPIRSSYRWSFGELHVRLLFLGIAQPHESDNSFVEL